MLHTLIDNRSYVPVRQGIENSFSFPVGKIRTERLYPLDFEEFMLASGKDMLLDECRKAFSSRLPVPSFMHEELLSAYRDYLVIGGMP